MITMIIILIQLGIVISCSQTSYIIATEALTIHIIVIASSVCNAARANVNMLHIITALTHNKIWINVCKVFFISQF
jgi:hypothetical protein